MQRIKQFIFSIRPFSVDLASLFLRLAMGLMLMTHGYAKWKADAHCLSPTIEQARLTAVGSLRPGDRWQLK